MRYVLRIVVLAILLVCPSVQADEYAPSFEIAKGEAMQIENNPRYRRQLGAEQNPFLAETVFEAVEECPSAFSDQIPEGFELVIATSTDGTVEKVYLSKELKYAKCMKDIIVSKKFPKPPISPMYLHLDMGFEE